VGRFEAFLRRLLSIKRAGLVTRINPEFGLSTDPIADGISPEQLLALGWRRYSAFSALAGVAAQNFVGILTNPPNSGIIAIVRFARVDSAAGAGANIRAVPPAGLAIGGLPASGFDSRLFRGAAAGATNPALTIQVGNLVPGGLPAGRTLAGSQNAAAFPAVAAQLNQPFVLAPNYALLFDGGLLAGAGNVSMIWDERALEASEGALS
jgi:hypothetical protein